MHAMILVKQMSAADDARQVADALLGLAGVDDVDADLNQQTVRVDLSDDGENKQAIVDAVENVGYTVDRIEMETEQ